MTVHGEIHWSELMTRDTAAARAFFATVAGWTFDEMPMPGGGAPYILCKAGDRMVCGIFDCSGPDFEGVPPMWMTYLHVDDVDRACEQTAEGGGTVRQPPFDVPGVGRIAVVSDPTGAVVGLMTPASASSDGAP